MVAQRILCLSTILLLLTTTGCTLFRSQDASPIEGVSKETLWSQTRSLEKEKVTYQKQLADQRTEIARLSENLSDQQSAVARANRQVSELNKTVEDLGTQIKRIEDARQRENPLQETELRPTKKSPATKTIKKGVKETKKAKAPEPSSLDLSEELKRIKQDVRKKSPLKTAATPETKRETIRLPKKPEEPKIDVPKGPAEIVVPEPGPREDLSTRMKLFEESWEKEAVPAPVKDEAGEQPKKTVAAKKGALKEAPKPRAAAPREPQNPRAAAPKSLKIKVLSGDGDIASARGIAKRLGTMGYRVGLIDRAERADFEATIVYFGAAHRLSAEAMAKRLGGSARTKPLTWSSAFDIIVVTGRKP